MDSLKYSKTYAYYIHKTMLVSEEASGFPFRHLTVYSEYVCLNVECEWELNC